MKKLIARIAVVALVLAAACTRNTDFTITEHFDPVNSAGGAAVYTYTQHVALASQAGSAWNHRSKIKSLDLVGLDATMTANHSGIATTGSGEIVLTRNGTNATAGTWRDHPIPVMAPDSIGVALDAGAVGLIEDALKNDGLFDVTFTGTTVAPLSFAADVSLHLKMTYNIP